MIHLWSEHSALSWLLTKCLTFTAVMRFGSSFFSFSSLKQFLAIPCNLMQSNSDFRCVYNIGFRITRATHFVVNSQTKSLMFVWWLDRKGKLSLRLHRILFGFIFNSAGICHCHEFHGKFSLTQMQWKTFQFVSQ